MRQVIAEVGAWIAASALAVLVVAGVSWICGEPMAPRVESALVTFKDGTVATPKSAEELKRVTEVHRGQIATVRFNTAANPNWLRIAIQSTVLTLLQMALYVFYRERSKLRGWFRFGAMSVAMGVAGGAGLIGMGWLYDRALAALGVQGVDMISALQSAGSRVLLLLLGGLVAPIFEEVYFRGRLHDLVRDRFGSMSAVWSTALLFALAHGLPQYLCAYFVFGVVLSVLRIRTNGLAASIVAHCLNNFVGLALILWT